MKTIKRLLVLILAAVGIFLVGYEFGYRKKIETFFKKEIKQIYVNRGIKNHDYTLIETFLKEGGREKLWKDIDRARKAVKDIYIFSYGELATEPGDEVVAVDTGLAYLGIKSKLTDYFVKVGDYYLLKEEEKPEELKDIDVYLKPYRGYFFLGLSREVIGELLENNRVKNLNLMEMDNQSGKGALGKVLVDLKDDEIFKDLGVSGAVTGGNLKGERLDIYTELYGAGNLIDSMRDQPQERKYRDFAGKNRIYISGNNIGKTVSTALKSINPQEVETLNIILGMLGVKVEEIFNQIDGEVIIDLKDNSWLIPLRDTAGIKNIFKFFGRENRMYYGERELVLERNLLRSGQLDITGEEIKMEEKTFIYGDLPMNYFHRTFTERARGRLTGKTSDRSILLELELNREATKNLLEEKL